MNALVDALGGNDFLMRQLLLGALVAARVMPLFLFTPWLVTRALPTPMRTALGLVFTVALLPLASTHALMVPTGPLLVLATMREVTVGFLFATASALPFFAFDWAGRMADLFRGASLAEVLSPGSNERTSPLGNMLTMFSVCVFFAIGGHRLALGAFSDSFSTLPVGSVLHAIELRATSMHTVRLVVDALALAVSLSAPVLVGVLVLDVGLGLWARSAPQVPVFFAGMPLRAFVGILIVAMAAGLMLREMPHVFQAAIREAKAVILHLGN